MQNQNISDADIAIVGISCRLPASKNVDEFWQNLHDGKNCISSFTTEEMSDALKGALGEVPEAFTRWIDDPNFVKAGAAIDDIDLFDAEFFGFNSSEAERLDPQQRIFLECAWTALEDAGYTSETARCLIGVYAGAEITSYHHIPILPFERDIITTIGNANDYLATRVSYKLNLKGPSLDIQCACSTSLAAIHTACQSLRSGECDMALAGGVVAYLVQKMGYLYQEGGILSPDGYCHSFDARAGGTVFANGGVGIVVLKRLAEAIADGDNIYAVIKGSAINNDGSVKTGYTAPGIEGQRKVILEALSISNVDPASISYIEAHGTATSLGDPIEIAALTQAFRTSTQKKNFCALGTVKSNMGHLGAASGVAGLIKTALALKHKMLPPSIHYEHVNPQIDFVNSPFYMQTKLTPWETERVPRRAGISSFGMGGSNAHAILEEMPQDASSALSRPCQLIMLSAKTRSALETMTKNLAEHLKNHADISLPDLAFTLTVGRKAFPHRRMVVGHTVEEVIKQLEAPQVFTTFVPPEEPSLVFMFSGQGTQYIQMGLELYRGETLFRKQIDICAELLKPHLQYDLRDILYPAPGKEATAEQLLNQTSITQPALFVLEYALAQLWIALNVRPRALIGHSIGEYVAACLAGVFSLKDALALVAIRGRLMQQQPAGSMLTVALSQQDLQTWLEPELSLAAINSKHDCVVSGPTESIERLEQCLIQQNIACRLLRTSHAFHSSMMDPILASFKDEVQKIRLHPPTLPYISNVTGTWITAQEATSPDYWAKHLRQVVRFSDGLQTLFQKPGRLLLEVGPGRSLASLARRHPDKHAELVIVTSLRHPREQGTDYTLLLNTCGQLWSAGQPIDWFTFYTEEHRKRISLPTYPFERKHYWKFPHGQHGPETTSMPTGKKSNIGDWFSVPSWKRSIGPTTSATKISDKNTCWMVFADKGEIGVRVVQRIEQEGDDVVTILVGDQFQRVRDRVYTLRPYAKKDYDALLQEMHTQNLHPTLIAHLWTVTPLDQVQTDIELFDTAQALGFYSLLHLTQACGEYNITYPLQIVVVSNSLQEVLGGEVFSPVRATVLGPGKVIPYEYPNITCRSIDFILPTTVEASSEQLIEQLYLELRARSSDTNVAYRGQHRWVQSLEPVHMDATGTLIPLRRHGIYLITGGFGGIGFTLAKYLAEAVQATLVITGRSDLPPRTEWDHWLDHPEKDETLVNKIRQVQLLEALGATVLVIGADIADLAKMQAAMVQIYQRFGALHGAIHAAGLAGGGIIQLKTTEAAARVLEPKVKGTLVLEKVTRDADLDFMVICSSLYSITGGLGQVDYCSANTFIDSFAFYNTASNNTQTIAINWDAWQEVGMAVNPNNTGSVYKTQALSPMQEKAIDHPLFAHSRMSSQPDETVFLTELHGSDHWIIDEHRIKSIGVVPGTALLEMLHAAAASHTNSAYMEIQDLIFFMPLYVQEKELREVRIALKREQQATSFVISSRTKTEILKDHSWLPHAEGKFVPLIPQPAESDDITLLKRRLEVSSTFEDAAKSHQEFMQFGPRWNSLQEVGFQKAEGLAVLELASNFSSDLENFYLHPALLDTATSFSAHHYIGPTDSIAYLPFSYGRFRINGPLPGLCISYTTLKSTEAGHEEMPDELLYDIIIMNEYGTRVIEIEDFCLRKVHTDAISLPSTPGRVASTTAEDLYTRQQQNRATHSMHDKSGGLQDGILPQEGVEIFKRILAQVAFPQIVVTARDIQLLLKFPNQYSSAFGQEHSEHEETQHLHSRPTIQTVYAAPHNETEQHIAQIWQQVLGIDQIGIHDDFLALGGDSVLSIQIISRLRTAFMVTLSMNLLFQAPTIESIAEIIIQKQMELLDDAQLSELLKDVSQMSEEEATQRLGTTLSTKEQE